jgi:hypothetical protein
MARSNRRRSSSASRPPVKEDPNKKDCRRRSSSLDKSNIKAIPHYMTAEKHSILLAANFMLEFCGQDPTHINGLEVFSVQDTASSIHQPLYVEQAICFFSILTQMTQGGGRVSAKEFYGKVFGEYDTKSSARYRKTIFKLLLVAAGKIPEVNGKVPLKELGNIFLESPGSNDPANENIGEVQHRQGRGGGHDDDASDDQDQDGKGHGGHYKENNDGENTDRDQDRMGRGDEENAVVDGEYVNGLKENAEGKTAIFNDKTGSNQGNSSPNVIHDNEDDVGGVQARVVDYCKTTILPYMEEKVFPAPASGIISVAPQCATPGSFLDHAESVFYKLATFVSSLENFAAEAEDSDDARSAANRGLAFCFAARSMYLIKMGRPQDAEEDLGRALEAHPTSGAVYCRMVRTASMAITCTNKQEVQESFQDLYQDAKFGLDNDPFAPLVRSLIKNMKQSLGKSIMVFNPIHTKPGDILKAYEKVYEIKGPTLGFRNWELALLIANTNRLDPCDLGDVKRALEVGADLLERALSICDEHLNSVSDPESRSILNGELTGPQLVIQLLGGDGIPAKLYAILLARSITMTSLDESLKAIRAMKGEWPSTFCFNLGELRGIFRTVKLNQAKTSHEGMLKDHQYWSSFLAPMKKLLEIDVTFVSNDPLFRIPLGLPECSVRLMEAWNLKQMASPISASNKALSCLEIVKPSEMPLEMLVEVLKYRFLLSRDIFRDPLSRRRFFTFREGLLGSIHLALLSLKKDYCQKGLFALKTFLEGWKDLMKQLKKLPKEGDFPMLLLKFGFVSVPSQTSLSKAARDTLKVFRFDSIPRLKDEKILEDLQGHRTFGEWLNEEFTTLNNARDILTGILD